MNHSHDPHQSARQGILETCTDCGRCVKECLFLQNQGSPLAQARDYDLSLPAHQGRAFECTLCGLCGSVCPVGINPTDMFLEMRQEAVRERNQDFKEHGGLLSYEKKGTSKSLTWYGLPKDCDTVFFPGCALPGTRPENTFKLYRHLQTKIPDLGIVLDCCTKPSHDLGRETVFHAMFGEMKNYLVNAGITRILVACPSCYKVFSTYGTPLETHTVYEFMADEDLLPPSRNLSGQVTVHDPCVLRYDETSQTAVRRIITHQGLNLREMDHCRHTGICCGEGGGVSSFSPELSENWGLIRKNEAGQDRIISYCAGCTHHISRHTPCDHIVDFYFDPEKTLEGKAAISRSPITYLNRFKLKNRFRKEVRADQERERPQIPGGINNHGNMLKRMVIMSLVLALIIALRQSGIQEIFRDDNLKQWVQAYGLFAPMAFMLLYSIAPSLFLPGLPITLAGGVLFGPFWGVVYSITGATSGACLSFLISRYLARDIVSAKLTHPRWQKLDKDVEVQGWKVVAFTRLIPLFPFNLLNYAFGLTRIGFIPYALTSFLCMLPACIAFIVFSSSLTELISGHITPGFVVGIVLIVLISLFPVFYKRFKKQDRQNNHD